MGGRRVGTRQTSRGGAALRYWGVLLAVWGRAGCKNGGGGTFGFGPLLFTICGDHTYGGVHASLGHMVG
jgi:hypothetical protein